MTMSRPETVASPLTVKEQFEASATRFWSSVKNLNGEEAIEKESDNEHPDMDLQKEQSKQLQQTSSQDSQAEGMVQPVSFQSLIHTVFGSCTTGVPYDGSFSKHSRSTGITTISPTCSRDHSSRSALDATSNHEGRSRKNNSTSAALTPPRIPSRSKLFQDSRDRAEEAVLHLREQQLQQDQDLRQQHQQSQKQKEYERVASARGTTTSATAAKTMTTAVSQQDCSNKTASSPMLRPLNKNNKNAQPLSFFPVSKPSTGRDSPGVQAVPKEVTSPARRRTSPSRRGVGLAGRGAGVPAVATTYAASESAESDDIFDFADDGVSVITQVTVDQMMRELEGNDFLLTRVCSDLTDPVDRSFGHWEGGNLFRPAKGESSEDEPQNSTEQPPTMPQEGRYMSPPRLSRQNRSCETRSFFTKTTHSSDPDEFNAWKQDEQQYWESLVAKEETTTTTAGLTSTVRASRTSGKGSSSLNRSDNSSERASGRTIPRTPRSIKLQRVRDKVKRNVVRLHAASVTSSNNASHTTNPAGVSVDNEAVSDHDRKMNVMMMQSEVDMAEI